MEIPVRCFSCGKVIADKWDRYQSLLEKEEKRILQENIPHKDMNNVYGPLGITRYCCKRMLMSHVDVTAMVMKYPRVKSE